MPNGFAGLAAERFFEAVNNALTEASNDHNHDPFANDRWDEEPPPQMPQVINQNLPFQVEDAMTESHRVGVGNESNIVVNQNTYNDVLRRIDVVDNQAGSDIFNILNNIERMCDNTFIVPETKNQITAITRDMKRYMSRFRSVTDEAITRTRGFVNEIIEIDRSR